MTEPITINDAVQVPRDELTFTASRSRGPGGQHVNKASTRVTLWFDLAHSPSLTAAQKARLQKRLASRINKQGLLRVASQETRSQAANKELAVARFARLLREALQRRPPRKKTRVPQQAKERRLEEKKRHSRKKSLRSQPLSEED